MAIDRRNLKVLANFCSAAADAMAFTLMRTAHSAFVKGNRGFFLPGGDARGAGLRQSAAIRCALV